MGKMNSATRIAVSILGVYAGLLGVVHGYFEILQGNIAPTRIGINAIGVPCQGEVVWHACLPAMTIIPNFLATGVLAIIFSFITIVWAVVFIPRKHGGLVLLLLSSVMLLVGGGFIPMLIGIIAGVSGNWINAPLTVWRTRFSGSVLSLLAKCWPWTSVVFITWSFVQWTLGYFFNQAMINLSCLLLLFSYLGLPLLTVLSGFACDIQKRDHVVVEVG